MTIFEPLVKDIYTLLPGNYKVFPGGYGQPPASTHDYDDDEAIVDPFNPDAPAILLSYQVKVVSDNARIVLIEKSRRIGISWCIACQCVLNAAMEGGTNCLYSSYNLDMTKTFIQDCAYWAKAFNAACSEVQEYIFDDGDKDILAFRIKFNSGKVIQALSSRPTNFRSKGGIVVLDEFAFIQNPEEVLKACMSLLIWGGRLIIISTHNGIANAFNVLVNAVLIGERTDISHHKITFDDALQDGLYKRICMVTGQEWTLEKEFEWVQQIRKEHGIYAAEELDCIPSLDSDVLFDVDAIDRNAIGKWLKPDRSKFYMASIDPNFGGVDYYTLLMHDITKLPVQLVNEYAKNRQSTLKSREDSVKIIKEYNPHLIAIEGNSGGMVVSEDLIRLLPNKTFETLITTKNNKIINTDRLATMVENDEYQYPADWAGIQEMKSFSKKLRAALVNHDDRVMSASIGLAFLQQAIETLPKRSFPLAGKNKITRF